MRNMWLSKGIHNKSDSRSIPIAPMYELAPWSVLPPLRIDNFVTVSPLTFIVVSRCTSFRKHCEELLYLRFQFLIH